MSFILDPSNHAITLAELNSMAQDFARLFKTKTNTFSTYTYEVVSRESLRTVLDQLSPVTSSFIRGLKVIPTLRSGNDLRLLYCPTISEFNDEFSGFTVFEYDTSEDPFSMITNSNVYWVVNNELQLISAADTQTAIDDFQRYKDNILISHDGSGTPSSFDGFREKEDATSSFNALDVLNSLASDNADSNNNLPTNYYFINSAVNIDGIYLHSIAESIFIPGTTSGNNPGNGPFTNKAADRHGICPPMCKKTIARKDSLIY